MPPTSLVQTHRQGKRTPKTGVPLLRLLQFLLPGARYSRLATLMHPRGVAHAPRAGVGGQRSHGWRSVDASERTEARKAGVNVRLSGRGHPRPSRWVISVTTASTFYLTFDADASVRGCPCPGSRRWRQAKAGCRKRGRHRVSGGQEARSERPALGAGQARTQADRVNNWMLPVGTVRKNCKSRSCCPGKKPLPAFFPVVDRRKRRRFPGATVVAAPCGGRRVPPSATGRRRRWSLLPW
jgi:hypothetical protein